MCQNIPHDNLTEISSVLVDRSLPMQGRITEYVRQIKDPYHYKCGEFAITEKHPENGPSFEDCLQRILT